MAERTSKIKGMKRCPDCSGTGTCKSCFGHGEVRIVQGRKKGSKFERDIAKDVSKWTGVEFRRTPMSGGWAKTGDITPKDPKEMVDFPFNIECKNQQVFSSVMLIEASINGELSKPMRAWWEQTLGDSLKSKKIPLLVMTTVREPIYVMMTKSIFRSLDLMKASTIIIRIGREFRVLLWKDFMKTNYHELICVWEKWL